MLAKNGLDNGVHFKLNQKWCSVIDEIVENKNTGTGISTSTYAISVTGGVTWAVGNINDSTIWPKPYQTKVMEYYKEHSDSNVELYLNKKGIPILVRPLPNGGYEMYTGNTGVTEFVFAKGFNPNDEQLVKIVRK